MSDEEKKPARKPLTLKSAQPGEVKQTFSHGRTNKVAVEVAELESSGAEFGKVHHLVSGENQEKAWSTGDIDAGMVTVGMSGGLINDIPTCEELVRTIVSDAEQIISERLAGIVAETGSAGSADSEVA